MIPLDRVRELLSLAPGPHGGTLMDTSMVHDLARDVLSLADALATAERERDTLRANRGTVDRILSAWTAIAHAHRVDPSPANAERLATLATFAAQLRDEALAERDAALRAHAELVAAVRAEREAESAVGIAGLCGRRESAVSAHNRAQRATDALLAAPAPSAVPAALVRAYLDAVDEWERERSAPVARTVARTAMIAARAALDAALAGCA